MPHRLELRREGQAPGGWLPGDSEDFVRAGGRLGDGLKHRRAGAETRELAGLLVEKYGYGLAKALAIAGELSGAPGPDLGREIDAGVRRIYDAYFRADIHPRW